MASNKQQINWEEVRELTEKLGNRQLLSDWGFVQNIAQPSLSCDKRIKMVKKVNLIVFSCEELVTCEMPVRRSHACVKTVQINLRINAFFGKTVGAAEILLESKKHACLTDYICKKRKETVLKLFRDFGSCYATAHVIDYLLMKMSRVFLNYYPVSMLFVQFPSV